MRYLGYGVILVAGVLGYFQLPVALLLGLAILGTLIFARSRRNITREDLLKPNPLVDGAYLFCVQLLILFTAYLLGTFAGTEAGEAFGAFVTGNRG